MKETISVKEVLEKEGYIIHRIKGVSMLPMLEEGNDLVKLEAVKEKDKLKKFDLILFTREGDGALVLHRIIKVKKKYYITYGDNCVGYEVVPFDKVLALAVGFYKKEKYISCDDPQYLEYVEKRCSSVKNREIYKKEILEDEQKKQLEKAQLIACKMQKQGKIKYWLRRFFPPKTFMAYAYPITRRSPILLPFFWILRLIKAVFTKSSRKRFALERQISKK